MEQQPKTDHERALEDARCRTRALIERMEQRSQINPLREMIDECISRARPTITTVELPDTPQDRL